MEEWLNYPLEDLLLFSRETYLRLFELYHRDVWPAHILAAAFGVAMLPAILRGRLPRIQAVLVVLAAMWAWIAYAFHAQRYAQINWAAENFGWLFAAQAGLMILAAIWPGALRPARSGRAGRARRCSCSRWWCCRWPGWRFDRQLACGRVLRADAGCDRDRNARP